MLKKNTIGFAVIPNNILKDNRLSMKARFLWAFINDKPEGWDFSARRMGQELGTGEKAVKSGLKELQECGYLSFEAKMDENGKFNGQEYILTDQLTNDTVAEGTDPGGTADGTPQNGTLRNGGGQNQKEEVSPKKSDVKVVKHKKNNKKNNVDSRETYNLDWTRRVRDGDEDVSDIAQFYEVNESFIRDVADDLFNYVESTGRTYKNHKATLRNWIKRQKSKPKRHQSPPNNNGPLVLEETNIDDLKPDV